MYKEEIIQKLADTNEVNYNYLKVIEEIHEVGELIIKRTKRLINRYLKR